MKTKDHTKAAILATGDDLLRDLMKKIFSETEDDRTPEEIYADKVLSWIYGQEMCDLKSTQYKFINKEMGCIMERYAEYYGYIGYEKGLRHLFKGLREAQKEMEMQRYGSPVHENDDSHPGHWGRSGNALRCHIVARCKRLGIPEK